MKTRNAPRRTSNFQPKPMCHYCGATDDLQQMQYGDFTLPLSKRKRHQCVNHTDCRKRMMENASQELTPRPTSIKNHEPGPKT